MIGSLAACYLLLGISHTAYLSWLSQRVPEVNWGRMLASRSIAISLVTIAMTGRHHGSLTGRFIRLAGEGTWCIPRCSRLVEESACSRLCPSLRSPQAKRSLLTPPHRAGTTIMTHPNSVKLEHILSGLERHRLSQIPPRLLAARLLPRPHSNRSVPIQQKHPEGLAHELLRNGQPDAALADPSGSTIGQAGRSRL